MKLKIKYLGNYDRSWGDLAYKRSDDSGIDLRAAIDREITLKPQERVLIPNGVQMEISADNYDVEIQIRPRSGLAIKNGIMVVNTPGTVDYGYRGEVATILFNSSKQDFIIKPGDRIAQAVVCPIFHPQIEVADEVSESSRGEKGFGSSGV